jgi:CHAD domain-containing protein
MTTSVTTPEGSSPHPIPPFTEHDKLGPLGTKPSVLDQGGELRRVLVTEFAAAAEAARDAAANVERDPSSAVHQYRKALRRARAVLGLVAGALPKGERRAVERALREARRALSPARDHAVAPEAIAELPLAEADRETAARVLRSAADAMPPRAEIMQLLAEGAARTAAQVEALEAALPAQIEWKTVARGVRRVYADAREARKAAKRSRKQFHTWRRRTKELKYQLELLADYAGPHVGELHRRIEGVTDTQSPPVDLIMLREFVETHAQGLAPEAIDQLTGSIDHQLEDLMTDSRSAGRDVFRKKPRRFARRLTKAIRRDLAPEAPAPAPEVLD